MSTNKHTTRNTSRSSEQLTTNDLFYQHLKERYPNLDTQSASDRLICGSPVVLPKEVLERIKSEIAKYSAFRAWGSEKLDANYQARGLRKPTNFAVCNSFDFHLDQDQQPKLIEINTNAAFLALGLELYDFFKAHRNLSSHFNFSNQDLVKMFESEIALCNARPRAVYILDSKPNEQRLFLEFLLYQEIFKSHGFECQIIDVENDVEVAAIPKNSLVYNRYTDFFLSEPRSALLKTRFNSDELHLSPHPWEYLLLADKQRFLDWNFQSEVEKPASLLACSEVSAANASEIWENRKNLFFKPKTSFGSKGVFKGASVSRKVFDELVPQDFIAQQSAPAPEIEIELEVPQDAGGYTRTVQKMKYDLRCYTYQEKLQLIIARVYQGQTTNLRTPGGGFTVVDFN